VIIRRFFDITADEAASLDDWVKAVSTLGNAAMRLSRLMVANRKLESDQEAKNEIKQAIDSVLKNVLPPGPEQLL
jgi:hypothetical protein